MKKMTKMRKQGVLDTNNIFEFKETSVGVRKMFSHHEDLMMLPNFFRSISKFKAV